MSNEKQDFIIDFIKKNQNNSITHNPWFWISIILIIIIIIIIIIFVVVIKIIKSKSVKPVLDVRDNFDYM